MTQSANPLQAFFRRPALYVRLPSDGQFWPPDSLDMPANHELAVLPMTAIDEITYRTPDALFNGEAIVSVIQSCVPGIKNAWDMPYCDLNTVLTAIRIASYGKTMPIDTVCPACNADNAYDIDLQTVMNNLAMANYSETVRSGDLEVFFKPMSYKLQTEINVLQFEQQRILNLVPKADEINDEEKTLRIQAALKEITLITARALGNTIASVRTPQALVTESNFIHEFLLNCDRKLFIQIRDQAINLRIKDDFKPMDMQCTSCQHQFKQAFTLDTANFFDNAS